MNTKKLLCFCLVFGMVFALVACGVPSENPLLEGKTDEETVAQLLAGYQGLDLPAVAYKVAAKFDMAGAKVSFSSAVSVMGANCSVASETETDGVSVPYGFTYVDGILYVNALGNRVKGAATAEEAEDALQQQLPFLLQDTEQFSTRTLLRSENGEYRVVLSDPKTDVKEQLNLSVALKGGDGEESPSVARVADFYVTLAFSSQGAFIGMTVGGDVTFLSSGVESLLTFEVKYTDVKTDGVTVSAPEDAEEYIEAEPETPATEGSEGSDATEDAE